MTVVQRTPNLGLRIKLQPVAATPDKPAPAAPAGGCEVTAVGWASPVRLVGEGEEGYLDIPYFGSGGDEGAADDPRKISSYIAVDYGEGSNSVQAVAYAIGPATSGVRWEHSVVSEPWPGSDVPLRADEWDYYTVDVYGPVAIVTQALSPSPYDNWQADITLRAYCGSAMVGELLLRIYYAAF